MIRSITISPVLNGYIVMVGCQTIVFTSIADLLLELNNYLREPESTEQKYLHHSINADKLPGGPRLMVNEGSAARGQTPGQMFDFSPVTFNITGSETGRASFPESNMTLSDPE